jgi:hypothetical protein
VNEKRNGERLSSSLLGARLVQLRNTLGPGYAKVSVSEVDATQRSNDEFG